MRIFIQSRLKAIQFAIEGLQYILRTQHNTWVHALATFCVIGLGIWLQLGVRDWAVLVLTICMVWAAEAMNTAIEALTDLTSPNQHPLAKAAKDTSATAVFAAAAGSVIIGLLILGPPLWNRVSALLNVP